jgi:hypothetical protein
VGALAVVGGEIEWGDGGGELEWCGGEEWGVEQAEELGVEGE